MRARTISILVIIVAVFFVINASYFYVDQRLQAIVLQFGEPIRVIKEPGIQFKIPFVQNVEFFDKRLLLFDNPVEEIISADKKRLIVDSFARYKIEDPLRYFQTIRFESTLTNRLGSIINDSLRQVLGRVPLKSVISEKRSVLLDEVAILVSAAAKDFGLQIEDVRIRRADLPTANSDAIFRRMQTERQQEASQYRAEGEEQSRILKAQAEKEKTILLADAERTSDILRGEGDGEKNKILGEAFSKDPEFFSFYRSMQAYINAISAEDTTMILSPDSTFFEYFDKIDAPDN
ncbi:MAG: Modulator of FtsH protease HflC [Alphaproteobacteria bacterium MarineAlpha9_Bin1]|nr:MAG: Modulator of FtsH protease HflC [Alphaproteobacteria bacterium MarineAlpha9_Bin1]